MMQEQCLTLMASAGSGKTFSLTLRYLSLLFSGANAGEILTLTFTKKAAGEMRERIAKALEDLAKHKETKFLTALVEGYGIEEEYILKNAPRIFESFLSSNLKITTLDAFFNLIVRKFCWNVGLSKNFAVKDQEIDEINDCFLNLLNEEEYRKILRFCIYQDKRLQIFNLLNYISLQEIDFGLQEIPIKLEDLENDILQSAAKIKERVCSHEDASSTAKNAINVEDFKTFMTKKMTWLIAGDEYRYFKKLKLNLEESFENLRQKIKLYYLVKEQEVFATLMHFKDKYKRARKQLNLKHSSLSFDDVTLKAYDILVRNFNKDFFYFRLDDKISHILLDEFQDTSPLQYQILLPLIDELRSGIGRLGDRSLFFVGDKKQSIYGFRGSDSSIFDKVESYTQTKTLEYNYRSTFNVIDFNNKTFEKIFKGYFQKSPNGDDKSGYVRVFEKSEDVQAMQKYILESLKSLFDKGVLANQIAILCYKNSDLDMLKAFLSEQFKEISFITESNLKLTQRKQPLLLIQALLYAKTKVEIYRQNVAKMLGLEFDLDFSLPDYEAYQGLPDYIFALMQKFGICDLFAQKFLEISFDYEDIDTFLTEIEKINIDSIKERVDGVLLMTIHSSKGLEFDHVIVCDRFSKPRSGGDNFIIVEDKIFYKQSNREVFDENYAESLKEFNKKKQQEAYNVQYVAFTRAKKSLFVIPKEGGEFEDLCLQQEEIGTIEPMHAIESDMAMKEVLLPIEQKDFGRQEDFIVKDRIENIVQKNIIFGEALHYALEYALGFNLGVEILKEKLNNHYGFFLDSTALETIMQRLMALRNDVYFQKLLKGKKSFTELVFIKDFRLNRIDMCLFGDEIIILDYKSGAQSEDHHLQVKKYLDFTREIFKDKVSRGYLIYLWEKVILRKVD